MINAKVKRRFMGRIILRLTWSTDQAGNPTNAQAKTYTRDDYKFAQFPIRLI
jgi:hypothetical protein